MSASKKSNKPDPKSPFAVLRGVKEKLTKEEGSRTAGVGGAKKPVVHATRRLPPRTRKKTDSAFTG